MRVRLSWKVTKKRVEEKKTTGGSSPYIDKPYTTRQSNVNHSPRNKRPYGVIKVLTRRSLRRKGNDLLSLRTLDKVSSPQRSGRSVPKLDLDILPSGCQYLRVSLRKKDTRSEVRFSLFERRTN